jgi:hypothetical protein
VHPFRTGIEKHQFSFRVRCHLCSNCPECQGKGSLELDHFQKSHLTAAKAVPMLPILVKDHVPNPILSKVSLKPLPFHVSYTNCHPHMQHMMNQLEAHLGKDVLLERLSTLDTLQLHAPTVLLSGLNTATPPPATVSGTPKRDQVKLKKIPLSGPPTPVSDQSSSSSRSSPVSKRHESPSKQQQESSPVDSPEKDFKETAAPTQQIVDFKPQDITTKETDKSTKKQFMVLHKVDDGINTDNMMFRGSCPKCKGKGWHHEGSAKHIWLKSVRCRYCVDCKGCDGSGLATNKVICPLCESNAHAPLTWEYTLTHFFDKKKQPVDSITRKTLPERMIYLNIYDVSTVGLVQDALGSVSWIGSKQRNMLRKQRWLNKII